MKSLMESSKNVLSGHQINEVDSNFRDEFAASVLPTGNMEHVADFGTFSVKRNRDEFFLIDDDRNLTIATVPAKRLLRGDLIEEIRLWLRRQGERYDEQADRKHEEIVEVERQMRRAQQQEKTYRQFSEELYDAADQ